MSRSRLSALALAWIALACATFYLIAPAPSTLLLALAFLSWSGGIASYALVLVLPGRRP